MDISFDINITREGCLADIAIKPKNIEEDLWIMIQVKSTIRPTRDYAFNCNSKYKDCVILCICKSDKKMWALNGNKISVKSKLSIGLYKSKYDEFEITKDDIIKKFYEFYKTFPKFDLDKINTPVSICQQLEFEYVKYREKMIKLDYVYNDKQGLVYDFTINTFKVQEKVGSSRKKRTVFV